MDVLQAADHATSTSPKGRLVNHCGSRAQKMLERSLLAGFWEMTLDASV
jgi:hypothetical protein